METSLIIFKALSDLHMLVADLYSRCAINQSEAERACLLHEINQAYKVIEVLRNVRF